jgi:hypothetical protein
MIKIYTAHFLSKNFYFVVQIILEGSSQEKNAVYAVSRKLFKSKD